MANSFELSRNNVSFSGCDISFVFGTTECGNIQALSFAVQREKLGVYVCGRKDPVAIARGKRGIAGSAVGVMFKEHLLYSAFKDLYFVSDKYAYRPKSNGQTVGGTFELGEEFNASTDISANYEVTNAWYFDQLPPLDVTIVAMNETGQGASMRILGWEIMNEGSGVSVESMSLESQFTWLARGLHPWQALGQFGEESATGLSSGDRFNAAT